MTTTRRAVNCGNCGNSCNFANVLFVHSATANLQRFVAASEATMMMLLQLLQLLQLLLLDLDSSSASDPGALCASVSDFVSFFFRLVHFYFYFVFLFCFFFFCNCFAFHSASCRPLPRPAAATKCFAKRHLSARFFLFLPQQICCLQPRRIAPRSWLQFHLGLFFLAIWPGCFMAWLLWQHQRNCGYFTCRK